MTVPFYTIISTCLHKLCSIKVTGSIITCIQPFAIMSLNDFLIFHIKFLLILLACNFIITAIKISSTGTKKETCTRRERTHFQRSNQVISGAGWPWMTASNLAALPWAQVIFFNPWTICGTVAAVSTPACTRSVDLRLCVQHFRT